MPENNKPVDRVDRILSICAILVALSATVIAVYETRMNREYQELSVWPYLNAYNSFPPNGSYSLNVSNVGLGPALIRSFQIKVKGKYQKKWRDVLYALNDTLNTAPIITSTFTKGMVLVPNTPITLLQIPSHAFSKQFFNSKVNGVINLRICYCSLYGNCWVYDDSVAEEPIPCKECQYEAEKEFKD